MRRLKRFYVRKLLLITRYTAVTQRTKTQKERKKVDKHRDFTFYKTKNGTYKVRQMGESYGTLMPASAILDNLSILLASDRKTLLWPPAMDDVRFIYQR